MAREQCTVPELLALGLPDDREVLQGLSLPVWSELDGAGARELREVAGHFGALGVRLAREDLGGEWFWRVFHTVAAFFASSLYELSIKGRPASAFEVLREVDEALNEKGLPGATMETEIRRRQVEELLGSFGFCASSLLLAADIDGMEIQLGQLTEKYDADLTAISALETFHEEVEGFDAEPLEVADSLLALSFEFRRRTVTKRFERWSRMRDSSSLVGVKELAMLSERDEAMVEKHGEKKVERVFEQKLDLIFQSLGFIVARARPGEAVGDLLCIVPPSVKRERRYSFLVEAKSSRHPYKLPKADWRAISDYVRKAPDSVPEIPPLKFVLIVGSQPAATIPERLRMLEAELGIPIRFSSANLIGVLHQQLAAPVPPQTFQKSVLKPPFVLSEELVTDLRAAWDKVLSKVSDTVRDSQLMEF